MLVDASDVRPSSILAIVATLGSVALLSFLLRVCGRGSRLRNRGTDEWLLGLASLCVVADVVLTVLRLERQDWDAASGDDQDVLILVWVETLVQILGFGLVKLSVALTVREHAVRNWHRNTIVGYICLITILTILWFCCVLLFDGPIEIDWSATTEPKTMWGILRFTNSVVDIFTVVLLTLLPLPLLWTSHFHLNLTHQLTLLAVYILTTAAIVSASLRTYLLHNLWQTTNTTTTTTITTHLTMDLPTLCSSIELNLGLLSASLLTLPLVLHRHTLPPRMRPLSKRTHSTASSPASSYPANTFASTDTVIRHPAPSLLTLRFHDAESNLDFDMETVASRSYPQSRAQTMRSQTQTQGLRSEETPTGGSGRSGADIAPHMHKRNVSDWSQFSGFTYYSTPAASARMSPAQSARQSLYQPRQSARQSARQSVHDTLPSPTTSRVVSVGEMEARTRALGVARSSGGRYGEKEGEGAIGIALTTVGDRPHNDGEGEEMQELARLFADQNREWGGREGTLTGTGGK